jgi:hypothetical protein
MSSHEKFNSIILGDSIMRRMRVLFVLLVVCAPFAFAEPYLLKSTFRSASLAEYLDVFSFPGTAPTSRSPAEILCGSHDRDFTPFTGANLGISDNEHWLRLDLQFDEFVRRAALPGDRKLRPRFDRMLCA